MLQKKKLVAALVDRGRKKREKERAFLENGGLVLEKLVSSCNGRPIPIRTFSYEWVMSATRNEKENSIDEEDCAYLSFVATRENEGRKGIEVWPFPSLAVAKWGDREIKPFVEKEACCRRSWPIPIHTFSYKELISATNNFDHRLILCNHQVLYNFYKGSFEGRNISVRSYYDPRMLQFALTDIGISAKTSTHTNILKLIGCCLETSILTLVYEYAQNGGLADQIFISRGQGTPMMWHSRLKIARQIAHVIAYLHTTFFRPIIHLSIKLENIFLDQHDVPKLTDFPFSISIPVGETHVELVRDNAKCVPIT
ncbi:serine/threonine-protein kinase ZRK1-like [Corylus avellana]|uniref:serine/threonine-protein kinase ZRK1-like n=1 Tax=Corylus avellana TaxID=13451 RepID=UPI00286B0546|nr:serine/threonine-protein kinase ZRK1-like [Corylus avellana]